MARNSRLNLYAFVKDMVDVGSTLLRDELGAPADRANELMLKMAQAICFRNAKSTVYIPEAKNLANMERNAMIWAQYQVDGPPPTCTRKYTPPRALELAAAYDLSPQQIYNILSGQRSLEVDQRQGKLTGFADLD